LNPTLDARCKDGPIRNQLAGAVLACHTTGAGFWREGMGTLRAREQDSHENVVIMAHGQANAEIGKNVCPTLSCNHEVPIATYDMRGNGDGVTVGCPTGDHARSPTDYTPVVAFGGEIARTLCARHNSSPCADRGMYVVAQGMQVRRLLPVECEKLQALPPGWTLIPWRGKPIEECPDGPRYKAIGNGQTVTVMEWLARRIMAEMTR
jgi:DNA (cytosine-5)-methyltransferase 1